MLRALAPSRMRAFQLVGHGQPGALEMRELPEPIPGADDAVVQVAACGLNHLDLWAEKDGLPIPVSLPRTPGCEISGRIFKLGPSVSQWRVGDRVAVQSNIYCGVCEFCQLGEQSRCLNSELLGVQLDGGFAEQVLVPARALVRLPEQLDFQTGASLNLAASTAMHMLTHQAQVKPNAWVLVMAGASGVGSAAIQIARCLGARVISTGSTQAKRELALRLGAQHALDYTQPGWPAEVRHLTGKHGVDLVIEHVGGAVLAQVFQCLARGGAVVTCGATAGRQITLDLWPFFVKEQRLIGSYGRNREDLVRTLDWAAQGKLRPVIDSVFPLERAATAMDRLRSRQALGKVMISLID